MSFIREIFDMCEQIKDDRTLADVLIHSVSEIGELAIEVKISQGKSYKTRGEDGVTGEAIDVIVCMLDIIRMQNDGLSQEEFENMVKTKIAKWQSLSPNSNN